MAMPDEESDKEPSEQGDDEAAGSNEIADTISEDNKRYCWVCFATDEEDTEAAWVQPCLCRGTTKWVHQMCIQRWVDEKQKGNTTGKVSCPQCNAEYLIIYPPMGPIVGVLDIMDSVVYKVCPFMAAGVVVGSIYWSAVTYGAVTVMQVVGQKEGLDVMERADPLILLVGLPTIPIMLILGKMVRWEDSVLHFIRKVSVSLPILRHVLPSYNDSRPQTQSDFPPLTDPVSATRVLCSALLLPSIATVFGKIFFESVQPNLQRTLMGGLAFIAIKGALKIYHKQQQYVRQSQRRILDRPRVP